MGYNTEFDGGFLLSKPATQEQIKYINTFSKTRRMGRNVDLLQKEYNGKHGFNGKYGTEGEYFAFDDGNYGQKEHPSILNFNKEPKTQPNLWCHWILSEDGIILEWDGGEKFYDYVKWLQYMIKNFFDVWEIKLHGEVRWGGDDRSDFGKILVTNSVITVKQGKLKN